LLADPRSIDLVVLASPTGLHAEQAIACLDAGVPVVVDKPLGTDEDQAARVVQHSLDLGVPLTVFQNRRWDAEQLTLRRLLADGALGEVFRFERRWERWRPKPKDRWRENASAADGGGLLLDLHSHLVDSAVQLFGPVARVYAEMAAHTTRAEDDVFIALRHESGVRSHLGALSVAGAPGPRTRVLGRAGSYVVTTFESELTTYDDLADLDDQHCGWLVAGTERTPVPRAAGSAVDFYTAVAQALATAGPMPVDPHDAVHVLQVLDAARLSAHEGVVVPL
jgi:predicted dehydrogenase